MLFHVYYILMSSFVLLNLLNQCLSVLLLMRQISQITIIQIVQERTLPVA